MAHTIYRYFFRLLLLSALVSVFWLQSAFASEHDADFTALLQRYVVADERGATFVDYDAWRQNRNDLASLDAYIDELTGRDLFAVADRDAQFAAWANLYNALTLKVVLDAYPVESIREIRSGLVTRGPWKKKRAAVADRKLSLDDIEHDILRRNWGDPRVHYAVNCASIGCPNLQPRAWSGETLNTDLDAAARAFVNHPRGARLLPDGGVQVSSIYKWFEEDFGGSKAGVRKHLLKYAEGGLATALQQSADIEEYQYDWSLNVQGARTK